MTNGGINNVGALRLSMSQGTALTSVRLTDAQIDAIMRCSTLELATTEIGGFEWRSNILPLDGVCADGDHT